MGRGSRHSDRAKCRCKDWGSRGWLISSHRSVCRGGDAAHLRCAFVLHALLLVSSCSHRSVVSGHLFAACTLSDWGFNVALQNSFRFVLECVFNQRELLPLTRPHVFLLQLWLISQTCARKLQDRTSERKRRFQRGAAHPLCGVSQ